MKIALLTIWHEKNYGAELQAYATIKLLQKFGHQVEMINIRLSDMRKGNMNGKIYNLICKFTPGHKKFNEFWNTHIPMTRRYKTITELQKDPPVADIFMVGSDQVWNPELTKDFSLLYFLNFGSDNSKRVSFASSFGTTSWNYPEIQHEVTQLLKRFNYITCREESGVSLLRDFFGVKSTNIVDPTLILGDYKNLIPNTIEKNTLLYYPLGTDIELEIFANKLSEELQLIPINNNKKELFLGRLEWNRTGIEEWLQNIAESKFVVTRSFHGLVFSLLFHRNFAIVATKNGRNSRIIDLLSLIGLTDRFYDTFDSLYSSKPWKKEIDYNIIDHRISIIRKNSINELKSILNV